MWRSSTVDADGAHVTFATSVIRPGAFPGYPFAIDLTVTYTLDARGLSLRANMRNVGETAAPCFFGWHPYFRLGDSIVDTWELQIPATTLVRTDADYIPLAGAAAYQLLDEAPPALDFRHAKPIGRTEINHAYVDLVRDADGRARTRLRDPATGMGVNLWQEHGVLLAFTADTVTRDVRRSIALEPMESMSDAFNRPDCASAIRLEPGARDRLVSVWRSTSHESAVAQPRSHSRRRARIAPYATVTPVLRSDALDAMVAAQLHFKCENLQRGGAFKFRGACNAVWSLTEEEAARGVVTHSSGNHGNALAMAAATRGIAAHVVVPTARCAPSSRPSNRLRDIASLRANHRCA